MSDDAISEVVEAGSEITGSVGGAAIGLLVAGPVGAVAGAAAGPVLVRVIGEVASRVLSRREKVRVGATFQVAAMRVEERIEAGEHPRDDGFFDVGKDGRADADEVTEGVLLAAQREYEERKVRFLGYLLANIGFETVVDRALAARLIRLANELSYRQLCLLSVVAQHERFPLPDGKRKTGEMSWQAWAVRQEFEDLGYAKREMVAGDDAPKGRLPTRIGVPALQRPAGDGVLLVELMQLKQIDAVDLEDTARLLAETYDAAE